MSDVLAFVEQREGEVRGVGREAVSAAARLAEDLGGSTHALLLGGPGIRGHADALGAFGAGVVHVGEAEALAEYHPEGYAPLVADRVRAGDYAAVVFPATTVGKDLAPRVAALVDVPLASDVTALAVEDGRVVATRPIYAGKAFARVVSDVTPLMVSIRPNVFQPEERSADAAVEVFEAAVDPSVWKSRLVEYRAAEGGALDVSEATIIVSGGRGMKDPSNWNLLEDLRDALGDGVALGASRAVVDAGWRPHGEQVGQTGKTVAPKMYVAIGISGAIQHLAGMRTSGTIVAINKDPDAPIFGVADYGIVGDLFEVVPRLTEEVRALKASG